MVIQDAARTISCLLRQVNPTKLPSGNNTYWKLTWQRLTHWNWDTETGIRKLVKNGQTRLIAHCQHDPATGIKLNWKTAYMIDLGSRSCSSYCITLRYIHTFTRLLQWPVTRARTSQISLTSVLSGAAQVKAAYCWKCRTKAKNIVRPTAQCILGFRNQRYVVSA
jgi:hypothetical protein